MPRTENTGDKASGRSRRGNGFTMIEMLVVITIILILIGTLTTAINRARQRARVIRAESGVRELVDAWRAYWIVYEEWPEVISHNVGEEMTSLPAEFEYLEPLLGDNPRQLVFLDIELDPRDSAHNAFRDPWGKPYNMSFFHEEFEDVQWLRVAVTFPNRNRYKE